MRGLAFGQRHVEHAARVEMPGQHPLGQGFELKAGDSPSRTQHLPDLHTATLFVQGTRDPFGSITELEQALKMIPGKTKLLPIEGAGHESNVDAPDAFNQAVVEFLNGVGE